MKKRYTAFTLVEMLIVMGILILLMAIGIAIGRYAIQRSQNVKHMDAARNLYSALIKYKLDHKAYPAIGTCNGCIEKEFFAYALGYNGTTSNYLLKPYSDEDSKFDGGSDATYYYAVDQDNEQAVVVCVSLGGVDDENNQGFYCTGDGIGILPEGNPITDNNIGSIKSGDPLALVVLSMDNSDWHQKDGFSLSGN